MSKKVALLLPCLNEAAAIGDVIDEARAEVPEADIFVFDNGSTDDSVAIAETRGAVVRNVSRKGKGNVVSRMFADVEADVYVLCDADGENSLKNVRALIDPVINEGVDMVVGVRDHTHEGNDFRPGHRFGNQAITKLVNLFFHAEFSDVLSGYRVFSRRFVKTAPIFVEGFEVETVLTVHAMDCSANVCEIQVPYLQRVEGSQSKLNTFSDGFRILKTIFLMVRDVRPFFFFSMIALVFFLLGLSLGIPVVMEFLQTSEVPRFPTAILASGIMVLSALSLFTGLILDAVSLQRREAKRLQYLTYRSSTA